MHAMILAAGLGERMQPLTADIPKPLLKVGAKSLIEHQVDKLVAGGVRQLVINHFHLGVQIEAALGDGSRFGARIDYSREPIRLETAGGIIKALPRLGEGSFIVVNSDIWTDFDYGRLQPVDGESVLAHLVLVPNAAHKPEGDFALDERGQVHAEAAGDAPRHTFSGISVLHRKLFAGYPIQPLPLAPLLRAAMAEGRVSGELHRGQWIDVGTPERLQEANELAAINQAG